MVNTFTVDSKNQLSSTPLGSASYDGNGNITSYPAHYGSGTPTRNCAYDDENRPVSVYASGIYRTDVTYDGLGRMRQRTVYTWNGSTWVVSGAVQYLYDGLRVIQERDGSGTPTASYTRGTDLSGSIEGAGGIGGLLARSTAYSGGSWSTHNFYHADGNGNITAMVDSSQAVSASYRYDPFGNILSLSGSQANANPYRFSSKEMVFSSDTLNSPLYYYLYRFYDPSLQRWLNRDPIEELGGINLYGFSYNESTTRVDPFGLIDWSYWFRLWLLIWSLGHPGPPTNPPNPPRIPTPITQPPPTSCPSTNAPPTSPPPVYQPPPYPAPFPTPSPTTFGLGTLGGILLIPWPGNPIYGGL